MQRLTLITVTCLLLLTQIPNVFANSGNFSNEIEKIEIKDGMKTIYYKNGLREVFFTVYGTVNAVASVETTTQLIHTPIEPFPIDKILRIITHVLDTLNRYGVGSTFLAWMIWNVIKRLRHGRPRDYRGTAW